MTYRLITVDIKTEDRWQGFDKLAREVNDAIEEGWRPQGGPAAVEDTRRTAGLCTLVQAMVRGV